MDDSSQSLRKIFTEAVEIEDAAERAGYLGKACASDPALKETIQKLLQAHEAAGGFLHGPADSDRSVDQAPGESKLSEARCDRIGRYKLLQKLGEGGCGIVYMAEQQEPVRRRLALKVIKLGMDTRSVIARFEAERQALALMDHPNIARVLDAGATETGRPFFVMELVRGVKITDYCDQNNLSTAERLTLFIQVCQAIQHAHQKGIIHRDIKPSNILVTLHDGVPVPKIIDFGIAKATTDQPLTDKTLFTGFQMFIGTPAYMSPEQAEMSGLDIDTRTDIYSLGVLLYELLTGRTPFDTEILLKSGLDAMRRTIRETEPTRPSTRLRTLAAADLREIAKRRQSEPPRLISLVRGDLDWIVLKALEKDRTRRYETANALATDIQRCLRDEPVVARPPSRLYFFRKLVRRNKAAFAAAISVALALVAGLGLSSVLFLQERHARQRAAAAEKTQRQLRGEAESAHRQTDAANRRLTRNLFVREWQDAENLLQQGKTASALAWFARAARTHPDDVAVVNRLVSALSEHNFALPLYRPLVHGAAVNSAAFSADGRLITAASDGLVRVWPLAEAGEPLVLSNRFRSPVVGFVPRDNRLLVVDIASVSLWELNGALVKRRPVQQTARPRLAMTPDGRFAALGCGEGGPQLWNVAELRPVGRPVRDADESFRILCASPDGRYIFGKHQDSFISAWEVSSGRRVWQVPPPGSPLNYPVECAEVHPDGNLLAVGHRLGLFTTWKFEPAAQQAGPSLPVLELHTPSAITALCFADAGRRLLMAASESFLQLENLTTGELQPVSLEHDGRVNSIQLSADGERLATASVDGTARVWDVRMRLPKPQVFTNGIAVWDAKFSPDGTWFVMGGMPAAEIRDAATGQVRHRLPMEHLISQVDISRDGRRIVISTEGGGVRVWDALTGAPVTAPIRFPHNIQHVEFSRDGRWFIAAAPREFVWVYETETGALALPPMTNSARVVSAHFSPDQRSLVAATIEGQLAFWSLPEGTRRGEPLRHKDLVWTTRFSPDGKFLITASSDRTAALWDLSTGRQAREFRHDKPVFNAVFSPDGKRILTGSGAREACMWDTETGRQVLEPMRHPGDVWHGEFSADGRVILTGDDAGNARIWDADSGLPLGGWVRNGRILKRAHLRPDLRRALCAANDGTVRLWPVAIAPTPAPPWLPELAETIAGRRLQEDGAIELMPPERWQTLGAKLAGQSGDDFYARWARWFRIERIKENPTAFEH